MQSDLTKLSDTFSIFGKRISKFLKMHHNSKKEVINFIDDSINKLQSAKDNIKNINQDNIDSILELIENDIFKSQ